MLHDKPSQNALNFKVTIARRSSIKNNNLVHGFENCELLESQEWSVFAFKHGTVNSSSILSFMYTDLSRLKGPTEVKLMTS